ncbi:V-type proton ATPase subunit F, partial [Lagopus leucura]|uniref:V-type proton ATPase subunit F n=1 Tax=Lagopus leucura TaxID=30410 RepID=UPI001C668F2F
CRGRAALGPHRPPRAASHPPNRPLFLLARSFLNRDDIGIILINQCVAELIRHAVEAHTRSLPAVLEIPSKEHPYDAARDSVLRRARGMFTADDLR